MNNLSEYNYSVRRALQSSGRAERFQMRLVEGNSATVYRKFRYRGYTIISRIKSHDARNKSHPGYTWSVENLDGQIHTPVGGTRAAAKRWVDFQIVEGWR